MNRLSSQRDSRLSQGELLHMARQWLGEFFEDVEVDPERLRARRTVQQIDVAPAAEESEPDPREQEALDCLQQTSARCRVRGLKLLAELDDPDLFEWCVMMLEDESPSVRVAALRTMAGCQEGDAEMIEPLAASRDKRIRAAAIAALARHAGDDAPRWFERGLKDPSACVRVSAASALDGLDPAEHQALFELALHDPNPQVARTARKLTAGKGFTEASW
jgi:HEAT repeat protein